ncbi:PilZ domain-containing protein [Pararhodobacter marinus]|uniref:PilZ domain-containing protein n=1 Tax=Pararhodobacter marinus TaxID=2184063 RepID=UPI00351996A5
MPNRALRLSTRAFVQVRAPMGAFDATLGNVSSGGARLLGVPDRMLRISDWVAIHAAGLSLSAEVRWHFDDTCGVMFEDPLTDYQITLILGGRGLY